MKKHNFFGFLLLNISLFLFSCSNSSGEEPIVEIEETSTSLILSLDFDSIVLGETVTLKVVGNTGPDFTNVAKFYADGNEIYGNTFTPSSRGVVEIYARYSEVESNKIELLTGFEKNVLIEDYTGTWCGYCPRVAKGIELVEEQIESAIPVAIHRGSADINSDSYDPFNFPAKVLENDIEGFKGYPTAMLNRKINWEYPETDNLNQIKNLIAVNGVSIPSHVGFGHNSTLIGNQLNITVNSKIVGELKNEKLVVYILENGLKQDQANYTSYYGGASLINDFVHDHVLRQVPTDSFGDAFLSGEFNVATNTYDKTFSFELTSKIVDKNNLDVVVFAVDGAGNVLNVQDSKVGATVSLD